MIVLTCEYCFFNKKDIGSLKKMQRHFGVMPNSYAGGVVSRVYGNYFGRSRNVFREYQKCYSKEFSTFEEFLISKLNISKDFADTIIKNNLNSYCDRRHLRDDISYYFKHEKHYKTLFTKYVGEVIYEDKSRICY